MESVVKKSLRKPIRTLTSCVTGAEDRRLCPKRRRRQSRGGGGRGGCNRLRKTCYSGQPKDPSSTRSYQADLDKERKQREAMIAQKNAERAAMRSHFRRKYQLPESPKDRNHLRSAGGKVSLPKELSKMIHPETKSKDDGFNLLSAFQGLSFSTAALTQSKHSKAPTPTHGESCRVM
ncbi:complexin-3 [Oryzias melastigma]|uniref:complexin-3 n=1 Tax=Oryzias melastigma TaxID=30732 RepID=UPI000CF83706|nr:complexin-3 [Oryzias melastigma]